MEILLVHRLLGMVMPEMMTAAIDLGKKICEKPGEVAPGGKLIASYQAIGKPMVVCLWDVPKAEALLPIQEQMKMLNWDTDMIPVEKSVVAFPKIEKALKEMTS